MATGKRYFWIRLSTDFMNSDAVDFLMQQSRGSDCIVLYLMTCLAARNSGGKLQSQIGDMIVPFDSQRIARESKFFTAEFVESTLPLFKRLGLIYEDTEGALIISGFDEMVGSRTDYADQKARQRRRAKTMYNVRDNVRDNVHTDQDQDQEQDQEQESDLCTTEKLSSSSSDGTHAHTREDDDDDDALKQYLLNTSFLEGTVDKVLEYRGRLSDDMIQYGVERAKEYGAHSFKYLAIILNDFIDKGITSIEAAEASQRERESAKVHNPKSSRYDPNAYADPDHVFGFSLKDKPRKVGGETIV